MKLKLLLLGLSALALFSMQSAFGQCATTTLSWDEDDLPAGSTLANAATPMPGPVVAGTLDIYDASTGAGGTDGTDDVQVTYEAVWNSNCANGTADANAYISAGWGGTDAPNTSGSDFGGASSDDCICSYGYIKMTVDYINGFSSQAGGFNFDWSSINGSSEGLEAGFGWVSAGTDANGTALTGLPTVNLGALSTYCGATISSANTPSVAVGATGYGSFMMQGDEINATANNCATSGQNGEDTDSGSGTNSGGDAGGVNGLAATDLITQVCFVYLYHTGIGTDCDGDGNSGVGSEPSGSFSGTDICLPPPPCSITDATGMAVCNGVDADVTINWTEMNAPAGSNWLVQDAGGTTLATVAAAGAGSASFTLTGPTTAATVTYTIVNDANANCSTTVDVMIPECNCTIALACPADVNMAGCISDFTPLSDADALALVTPTPDMAACAPLAATVTTVGPTAVGDPCDGGSWQWVQTINATALDGAITESCSFTTTLTPEPLTITCPAPLAVECPGEVPAADIASATAAGGCGTAVIEHVGDISNGASGCMGSPIIIMRAYRATDDSGCTAVCVQQIMVEELTPRTLVCPETPVGLNPAPNPPIGPVGTPNAPMVTGPCDAP